MNILVLCGKEPTEWQIEFAKILGGALHEYQCSCLVACRDTPFVSALASSGIPCPRYIKMDRVDAYILVGKSDGVEETLEYLSPLLIANKREEHPKPFVLVDWSLSDLGHIRALFGIPPFLQQGEERGVNEWWFSAVAPQLPPNTSVKSALNFLGLAKKRAPAC